MNLYFRFFLLLLKRLIVRQPASLFGQCRTSFRVNLLDLDFNMHMNNGRYFAIMDLGRFDLMLKSKTFWEVTKKGYYPVVSSQSIRFKKSLDPFQRFDVITQIDAWDEKDTYINQKFVRNGIVYAEAVVKARFLQRGRKGSVPMSEILALLNIPEPEHPMNELTTQQKHIETLLVTEKEFTPESE
ncbi:thioesterase [Marinomonas agarivorans]|nr:thioesterase [Marinomonas agarivorans]